MTTQVHGDKRTISKLFPIPTLVGSDVVQGFFQVEQEYRVKHTRGFFGQFLEEGVWVDVRIIKE